jgi:hypothetical protein
MLTVTTHRARVIYIQRRRGSMYRLRDGTELGWSWPLDQLAWVRQRAGKNVQFGFPDGRGPAWWRTPLTTFSAIFPICCRRRPTSRGDALPELNWAAELS